MTRTPTLVARNDARLTMLSIISSYLAFRIHLPFFPLYLQELNITEVQSIAFWSGLLYSVTPLVSGLLAPFWGSLADRYGTRKVALCMLVNSIVILTLMAFVTDVYQLFALRLAVGFLTGYGSLAPAIVAQQTTRELLGSAIGALHAWRTATAAIGPLIGGIVMSVYGPRATFLVSAGFVLIALLLLAQFFAQSPTKSRFAPVGLLQGMLEPLGSVLRLSLSRNLLITIFLGQFILQGFEPVLPIFISILEKLDSPARTTGLVLSLGAIAGATSAAVMGRLTVRVHPSLLLGGGALIAAGLCIGLALSGSIATLALFYVALSLAAGGLTTVAMTWGGHSLPQELRATGFGIFGSAVILSASFGPLITGVLAGIDIRTVFVLDMILFIVLFLWTRRSLPHAG